MAFLIHPLSPQLDPRLIELLQQAETATLGHILHHGFIDPLVACVNPGMRVAGTAVTVRIPGADSTLLHKAVSMARPGDVLVVDRCGDRRHACWGGVTTEAAKAAGIAAVVIDGPATDLAEIRKAGLPVWCRGTSALTTKFLSLDSAMNVPVSVGGVAVCAGDAILADDSGVVVMRPADAQALAEKAIALQAHEVTVLARLRAQEKLECISGADKLIARSAP